MQQTPTGLDDPLLKEWGGRSGSHAQLMLLARLDTPASESEGASTESSSRPGAHPRSFPAR